MTLETGNRKRVTCNTRQATNEAKHAVMRLMLRIPFPVSSFRRPLPVTHDTEILA